MNVAKKRTNVVPIIEDARHPHKYRMLVPMVDTIFADVAQPDQARIVAYNAQYFLKNGGHFVISIKVFLIFDISGRIFKIISSPFNFWSYCNFKFFSNAFTKKLVFVDVYNFMTFIYIKVKKLGFTDGGY